MFLHYLSKIGYPYSMTCYIGYSNTKLHILQHLYIKCDRLHSSGGRAISSVSIGLCDRFKVETRSPLIRREKITHEFLDHEQRNNKVRQLPLIKILSNIPEPDFDFQQEKYWFYLGKSRHLQNSLIHISSYFVILRLYNGKN